MNTVSMADIEGGENSRKICMSLAANALHVDTQLDNTQQVSLKIA